LVSADRERLPSTLQFATRALIRYANRENCKLASQHCMYAGVNAARAVSHVVYAPQAGEVEK